jgi:hypothetical protein
VAFTPVTVTFAFVEADGSLPEGTLSFAPTVEMANGGEVVDAEPIIIRLNGGAGSVILYATDDPGTAPAGVTYQVVKTLVGEAPQSPQFFALARAVTPVDLSTLTPLLAAPQVFTYALQSALLAETARAVAAEAGITAGAGVTSVTAADATVVVAGTASAPTVKVGAVGESLVSGLVSDLAAKATAASVTAETNRATAAEGADVAATTTETTRATAVEGAESTRATAAEVARATVVALTAETNRATAAEAFGKAIVVAADAVPVTFDLSAGNTQLLTLLASRTLAVSNDAANQRFTIILATGAGAFMPVWWAGIRWAGGAAPTVTATAGKYDVFTFLRVGAGVYLGFVVGQAL